MFPVTRLRPGGAHSRLFTLAAVLALVVSVLPNAPGPLAPRAVLAAPASVTIAGSLDQAIGCTNNWDQTCAAAHLTYDANDDVWQGSWSLPAGSYEYKAALNDSWDVSYGINATSGGANIPLTLAAPATVKFYYDDKTHWVTDNVNSVIATAPGDYQTQLGCSGNWDPGCLRSWLEDPSGSGTYSFVTTALLHGSYQAKAAINESWDESYGAGGVSGGPNINFTVPSDHAKVTFRYNPTTHILSISAGLSHDNNVEYDGLAHDSRDSLYRVPSGAVTPGTQVSLRFRTFHNDVTGVTIRLYDTAVGQEDREPMALVASNVDCYDAALTSTGSTCDFWQFRYTPQKIGTTYYRFIISDGTATAYYADNAPRYGGLGQATPTEVDNGFRLNTVSASFPIVGWMQNGVMYQVFPDRFRNGDTANDPKATDPRYDYPAPAGATPAQVQAAADAQVQLRTWAQLPEGYCRDYVTPATPCTESPKGRDYFGGDIKGVDDKLAYLKRLGVTIIYFNPIFESGSNHGYDTRDYLSISNYFASSGYFKKFMTDAGAAGIKVILDGVFNHLSSDSPFFDRYHHYATVGACESTASLYRSWFLFHDVALGAGPCVGSDASHSATYDGWAGYDSIPVIVKRDPTDPNRPYAPVANYFYTNPITSVAGYWLNRGASGWRFDVMTDTSFPAAYWQQLRTITKGIKPDETLIAEAWHWYDNLPVTQGDQADTAMGYRFRNAVLGLLGAVDDKGFAEESNPNLPPSTFAARMLSIREDYADATYYTFQNLLDSHDTKRVLWSLTPGLDNRQDRELNAANVALGKKREAIAALVQMTVPGTPTIYYGDEVSLTGASDPDDRRPFPWKLRPDGSYVQDPKDTSYYAAAGDHATFDWYRTLTGIRATTPVLRTGALTFLLTDDKNKTLVYALRGGDSLAIVVINRNETATQSITVPTAPYLRNGVTLTDALGAGRTVTTAGGSFSTTLAPLGGAIFVMRPVQDITGPVASTGLTATAHNGVVSSVSLAWTGNADSASYNVYRSPVQGGGYVKIGTTAGTSFTDTTVSNGTTYYYIVRGLDSLGNEGAVSNEASASPAFPIGYAVLQWPKTITEAITSSYTMVYGQVYIQGFTDSAGDPSAILAQVGYGATGTSPDGWTTWTPMAYNPGHTGDDNYEYQGGLRADAVGTYDYLVRFSDDGGQTWVYGDQDGFSPGNPGTNKPGVLTLTASSDTTAPSAPVASIDFAATSLRVSWTASTDPDDAVAEYHVFRGTTAGGEGTTPIAVVSGTTLSYLDTSVASGQTYYYQVQAFDTSLNASLRSNEVSHQVKPKVVQVTFRVKVPGWTPSGDIVYISGQSQGVSPDPLCNYCGGAPATAMTQTAPGSHLWQITLGIPDGTPIQYKYTRGTYDYVEEWGSITGFTNRVATVAASSPTDLTRLFDDTSDTTTDDNHKAVQNWRDAIVTGTSPAGGSSGAAPAAITVTFNWDVKSDGTDFSTAIAVAKGGSAVTGTITHDPGARSLTFTPSAPFTAGTCTVTVDHVVSLTVQNDGVKIRTPYMFSFTVN